MQHQKLPGTVWAFIWHFLRVYPKSLIVFVVVSVLWAAEISISPYLLKLMIDGVNATAAHPDQLVAAIAWPAIWYVALTVIMNAVFRLYGIVCLKLFPEFKVRITTKVFDYLAQHSYRFFQENMSGTLIRKVLDLAEEAEQLIQIPNTMFIPRVMATFVAAVMLCLVQPIFGIFLFVWSVIFTLFTYYLSRWVEVSAIACAESYTKLSGRMTDSVTNIVTAKLFARERYESERMQITLDDMAMHDQNMQWKTQLSHLVQGFFVTLLVGGMLYGLVKLRIAGTVTVGDFAFILSLTSMFAWQIWDIGQQLVLFTKTIGRFRQALSIVIEPLEISDAVNAKDITIAHGEIEFRDVTFHYASGSPTLQNISLTIEPGQKVGLVGFSGSGKSTFVRLILRLFEIQVGEIIIDGQPIKQVTRTSLRRSIAMIPQEPELFHRTIAENIAYAHPEATREEIIAAAKQAHCHEFIMKQSAGYDSIVGEKGIKLSGGQRQRIAIARAILKQAHILILDEATSALDSETERYIQETLHDLMQGKTTLVVAHRLSTLQEMDRILFFKEGRIIEDGSLPELIAKGGYFAKLWEMQGGGYIPEVDE